MYSDFFRLQENPFSETPDIRFFFSSSSHLKALNVLLSAVEQNKCFSVLVGEVGTGKTLLTRVVLRLLEPHCKTALVFFPALEPHDLLIAIAREFEIPLPQSAHHLSLRSTLDAINDFLVSCAHKQKKAVLVIDEAQLLPHQTLEIIRLLTNLESDSRKLLQIILVGQTELLDHLQKPSLRQLCQRVSALAHLQVLKEQELESYLRHRIEVIGNSNYVRFDKSAIKGIFSKSRGVPRLVNKIAELSLQFAAAKRLRLIDSSVTREVIPQSSVFVSGRNENLLLSGSPLPPSESSILNEFKGRLT